MASVLFPGKITASVITAVLFFSACKKDRVYTGQVLRDPVLPAVDYDYENDTLPSYFDTPLGVSINYPVTNAGAKLGRVLFYDQRLSLTNQVSCGSCHLQQNAFSDPHQHSTGISGRTTQRHSMAIFNVRFSRRFFWDHRVNEIEDQVLQPIQHPHEMGMDLARLTEKLSRTGYYPPLFQEAFGSPDITSERIGIALGMFVQSILSYRSKYDTGEQTGFANFTSLENDGRLLFTSGTFNCVHCHGTANFSNGDILNNGIDPVSTDAGYGAVTGNAGDIGKFKVPSLRNITLTAPYMHDGRFKTLEEVMEHYNSGIHQHVNLDDRLATNHTTGGPPKRYHMTSYEKQALLAFLKTLTDEALTTEPKWSDPFKQP